MPKLIDKIIEFEEEINRRHSAEIRKRVKIGIIGFVAIGLISYLGYFSIRNYEKKESVVETTKIEELPQLSAQINNTDFELEAKLKNVNGYLVLPKEKYVILYDIVINQKGTLEIEPGTEIYFGKKGGILAYGTLKAIGTEQERIIFTANSRSDKWKNISFVESFSDKSMLNYCNISYGSGRGEILQTNKIKARDGGGLLFYYSNAIVENCLIANSQAENGGGLALDYSNPTLRSNIIENNYAKFGGGLKLNHSNATLEGNMITNNQAELQGGGFFLLESNPTLKNNKIKNNRATEFGGGFFLLSSYPILENNTITNNQGGTGGGFYLLYSEPTVDNTNLIKENTPKDIN